MGSIINNISKINVEQKL
jgi:calcium-dependent protein kinase